ncbi:hypothetical protein M427DRAFT_30295 [Gonapodya prolifera JEL478]|uniref:Uncharacterized protein n=1 Tax=Gonapodya prolifera (strain JEL478) TaxID=1344416 RepID=A0A139ALM9_GONPJ|nr:hypothetical protein M427DRAFT_30295 [Gonapodya prolifera JEL478]|eukprot:KXS17464.1 hypothetical protein M427DRAFT_30295 [Gonapodya prolifera JEL478]
MFGIIGLISGAVAVPLSMSAAPISGEAAAVSAVSIAESAVSQGQSKQRANQTSESESAANTADQMTDPRLAKFHILAHCEAEAGGPGVPPSQRLVVLREGKLYLDEVDESHHRFPDGHPFAGFYVDYPFRGEPPPPIGLVSTISVDPPKLNWIYVDGATLEVKYGNKTQTLSNAENIITPWDWTSDGSRVTLEGWEGFVALEETPGCWVLCYDKDEDHMSTRREGRAVMECFLIRQLM